MTTKPLGRKAYGSIPHLPGSRMGPGDHKISDGHAKIATQKARKNDKVIITEKLDGSNVAVAKINGRIVPLIRSGYIAETSRYLQHHIFSDWVYAQATRFESLLSNGEWVSGEWIAQAHGTRYVLKHEPFVVFDLWTHQKRNLWDVVKERCRAVGFTLPREIEACDRSIESVMAVVSSSSSTHGAIEAIEGAVWRVETPTEVDFLCKYVRPDKVDGKYLPEISGNPPVWNALLENWLPVKAMNRLDAFC